jgi:hypothetical protein
VSVQCQEPRKRPENKAESVFRSSRSRSRSATPPNIGQLSIAATASASATSRVTSRRHSRQGLEQHKVGQGLRALRALFSHSKWLSFIGSNRRDHFVQPHLRLGAIADLGNKLLSTTNHAEGAVLEPSPRLFMIGQLSST